MTKTAFIATFAVISSVLAFGAPRPETTTYVDGNVSSLKPNTGGTLVFPDDHSMLFRTGLAEVAVPYSSILRAELGATQTHNHDQPAYKFWTLPTRLHRTETQLLIVEFKNGLGDSQTMTLELSKPAASDVLATIEEKTSKPADKTALASASTKDSSKDTWWGDGYWKTTRNQDTWGTKQASTK